MNLEAYKSAFTQKESETLLGKDMDFWSYYSANCRSDLNKFYARIGVEQQKKLLVWCKKAEIMLKVFKDWDLEVHVEDLSIGIQDPDIIMKDE